MRPQVKAMHDLASVANQPVRRAEASATSPERTAKPSIAELENEGTSSWAPMGSALPHWSAAASCPDSGGMTGLAETLSSRASPRGITRSATPASMAAP